MTTTIIDEARLKPLNDEPVRNGDYVLYWMQQSQRAQDNLALEHAIHSANHQKLPLLVCFGLMDDYPEANLRHYRFMLEGLQDAQQALARRGIRMIVQHGQPAEVALDFAKDASMVVCDRGYLRPQKAWRRQLAANAGRTVVQVEADVVVPVEVASTKAEYAARTIRPKLTRYWRRFLVEHRTTAVHTDSPDFQTPGEIDISDLDRTLAALKLDRSVPASPLFTGGTSEAKRRFRRFLRHSMPEYDKNRKHSETDDISHLSPYLHFGQVSPLWLALCVHEAAGKRRRDRDAWLEELLVRRELAQNFCEFTADYDRYSSLPDWARKTLGEHRDDEREHVYTQRELENAATHDPYWNAAMLEMRHTGFMHNYMRMYWGKKIIEWTNTPEHAHRVTLALNNKYFIDGRDANSFVNVNWLFGLHDRPWFERPVFGKIRWMSAGGLERKGDPQAYVQKVEHLVRHVEAAREQVASG